MRLASWIIGMVCVFGLCACSGGTQIQPSATAPGLKMPEVTNQALFTPTPVSLSPTTSQSPTIQFTDSASTNSTLEPTIHASQAPTQAPTQDNSSDNPTPIPTITSTQNPTPISTKESTQNTTDVQTVESVQGAGACNDKAAYYDDVTIPDITPLKQNVEFTKTWQIRNEGTCVWNGYHLVSAGGDIMNGKLSNPMPVVQPGELVNISVDLKSPPQGGLYTGLWEFESKDGKRFGVNSNGADLIWVKISVSWYTDTGVTRAEANAAAPADVAGGTCAFQKNTDYETQVLQLVNQARKQNGLAALKPKSGLSTAAAVHSQDMACKNFVDHTGSDGSTWYTRIKAQNYAYSSASENIYVGDPQFGGDPQGAFTWWMNSQIHRDNILNPKATSIGIGYAYTSNSDYKGYYTIDFARP